MRNAIRIGILALIAALGSGRALAQTGNDPARSAYQDSLGGFIEPADYYIVLKLGIVPDHNRLVIEQVGVQCFLDPGDAIHTASIFAFRAAGNGAFGPAVLPILMQKQGEAVGGRVVWGASLSVRLYADSGINNPWVNVVRTKTGTRPECAVHISGYTVPVP